jgi:hypothetical protein
VVRGIKEIAMARPRVRARLLSPRRVLLGVLGLCGGLVVAILHGGLTAVGHEIIQKSQIIQHEIEVIQREIDEWIRRLRPHQRAAMRSEELRRACDRRAMNVMPTEGLPGFIEKKGNCLKKVSDVNAL